MLKVLEKKAVFICTTAVLTVVFLVLSRLYSQKSDMVYVLIASLVVLAWTIYCLFYVYMIWLRFIDAQIKQYREKNSLASGIVAWLSFFAYLVLVPGVFWIILQGNVPATIQNGYSAYLNIVIAVMPAVLGLLGVQYTIAIQNKNRAEDIRLAQKPFLTLEYKVGDFISKNRHTAHGFSLNFRLKNISDNIAIPIGFGSDDSTLCYWFPYSPIPKNGIIKSHAEIDMGTTLTSGVCAIKLYYKDTQENYYCICVYVDLANTLYYGTSVWGREFLCPPETVEWLKETAFTKTGEYWRFYEVIT